MKITLLGTGASQGVPVPLCSCKACTSTNPKDNRLRCSAFVEVDGFSILIDPSIDFRLQALRANIKSIDAILLTHHHYDHLFGIDDVKAFTNSVQCPVSLYMSEYVASHVMAKFEYIFDQKNLKLGLVFITPHVVKESFAITKDGRNLRIIPIKVDHGKITIYGYRIANMAYLTDCKTIPEESAPLLKDLEILFTSALSINYSHPAHASVSEALVHIRKINPKRAYLTHIHHSVAHDDLQKLLPKHVYVGYDQLEVNVPN